MKKPRHETFDADYLRSIIDYSPDGKPPRWRVAKGRNASAGSVAGGLNGAGYWCLMIDGHTYIHELHHALNFAFLDRSGKIDRRVGHCSVEHPVRNMEESRAVFVGRLIASLAKLQRWIILQGSRESGAILFPFGIKQFLPRLLREPMQIERRCADDKSRQIDILQLQSVQAIVGVTSTAANSAAGIASSFISAPHPFVALVWPSSSARSPAGGGVMVCLDFIFSFLPLRNQRRPR